MPPTQQRTNRKTAAAKQVPKSKAKAGAGQVGKAGSSRHTPSLTIGERPALQDDAECKAGPDASVKKRRLARTTTDAHVERVMNEKLGSYD